MKTNFLLVIFLCSWFCSLTHAQGEYVIEINRTNGSFAKPGLHISGIQYVYPQMRAYDENTGTFIFPSSDSPTRLYSIDVTDNGIVYNPVYNNYLCEFEFCNANATLYGLWKDIGNDVKYLASINQTTGASTTIGAAIPSASSYQGFSTFDQANMRYIFLDPSGKIFTIDATNGNVISNPTLSYPANNQMVNFCFNETTNSLLGIIVNSLTSSYSFVSINTITGAITTIGSSFNLATGGSSAIDLANQQFIYLYYATGEFRIATIDISTGAIVYDVEVSPLEPMDNVASLKYDNIQGKLFSIHWDSSIEGLTIPTTEIDWKISLSPNPFTSVTTLQTSHVLQNATLTVYNVLGEQVMKIQNINGQTLNIHRNNLPAGIYTMQLVQFNQVLVQEQLVIGDN